MFISSVVEVLFVTMSIVGSLERRDVGQCLATITHQRHTFTWQGTLGHATSRAMSLDWISQAGIPGMASQSLVFVCPGGCSI
jgi:hypothetical protein